jgi:hypothetical protein
MLAPGPLARPSAAAIAAEAARIAMPGLVSDVDDQVDSMPVEEVLLIDTMPMACAGV